MTVEAYGSFSDDDCYSRLQTSSKEGSLNEHIFDLKGKSFSHAFKTFPLSGEFKMNHQVRPMKTVGGSVEGSSDTEGNSKAEGEVHVTAKDDNGGSVSVSVGGSIQRDGAGNVSGEGHFQISVEKDF